ncbi:MAG: cupin domain-containing protein [Chloroflexi bacterium]|nr:cupin domain-containing protein [Chloroflexota bacterium]
MTHEHTLASEIVITHPEDLEVEISSGAMTRLAGVSELLTGSTGIHLAIATVPPGRCSTAHYHTNCESAIYVVSGAGLFLSGSELENEQTITEGDFIFVPPDANHQPVNTSDTDDLVLIVARNAPVELVVELECLGRKDC